MPRTARMGVLVRRDPSTARMVAVSAMAHATLLVLVLFVLPLVKPRPLAMTAYTVELTDSSSLGGRLAPGRTDVPPGPRPGPSTTSDAAAKAGEPVAKTEPPPAPDPPKPVEAPKPLEQVKPPEPPKPPAPKPAEPAVKLPSIEKPPPPKPEAQKPPAPKPEQKPPEPKPVEAKKPEPA